MKEEWKVLKNSTWMKIVMIAIITIPAIYAGVFLGSMWDPYGAVDQIPVAVVNLDESTVLQGKTLTIGKDLGDNLKEHKAMDFRFVDEKEAEQGLQDGTYYMTMTIPKDFSKNASTIMDQHPKKMELYYKTNPGKNYIATKMGDSAMNTIRDQVSATVTKSYIDTIFSQLKVMQNGISEAVKGSGKLYDGSEEVQVGSRTLQRHLDMMAKQSLLFHDGTDTFAYGLTDYLQGVEAMNTGADTLQNGLQSVQSKMPELQNGMNALLIGSSNLQNGVNTYTQVVHTFQEKSNLLTTKQASILTGTDQIGQAVTSLHQGSTGLLQGVKVMSDQLGKTITNTAPDIQQLQKKNEEGIKALTQIPVQVDELEKRIITMKDQQTSMVTFLTMIQPKLTTQEQLTLNGYIQQLQSIDLQQFVNKLEMLQTQIGDYQDLIQCNSEMLQGLSNGLQNVKQALDQQGDTASTTGLIQHMNILQAGIAQLDQTFQTTYIPGIHAYTDGVSALALGTKQIDGNSVGLSKGASDLQQGMKNMYQQMPSLQEGIYRLTQGSNDLKQGSQTLVSNNKNLREGMEQLKGGSTQLYQGADQLYQGSTTLTQGFEEVGKGTKTLQTSLEEGAKKSDVSVSDDTKQMMTSPIDLAKQELHEVENNGHAMAPYMMSVGLYVACMAFTLMYPLLSNPAKTKSGYRLWLGKASVMYSVSTIMAFSMIIILMMINGMHPVNILQTMLSAMIISAGYMAMISFLSAALGKAGSFIILIFMVLQLGGAAGTYPIETSNAFFTNLHPFLPFTYSVDIFRNTLAKGGNIVGDISIFLGMIVLFSICSILFYQWRASKSEEQLNHSFLTKLHS